MTLMLSLIALPFIFHLCSEPRVPFYASNSFFIYEVSSRLELLEAVCCYLSTAALNLSSVLSNRLPKGGASNSYDGDK